MTPDLCPHTRMCWLQASGALRNYGVHAVVANILHTRKDHVLVVSPAGQLPGALAACLPARPPSRLPACLPACHEYPLEYPCECPRKYQKYWGIGSEQLVVACCAA
jgi:hypothetical protein